MTRTARDALVPAGFVLGAGLGGFVDGIVLHQILQWHNMVSGIHPVVDLVSAKVNMFWDGLFHAGVWLLTLWGIILLWRVAPMRQAGDGYVLSGSMLGGGVFSTSWKAPSTIWGWACITSMNTASTGMAGTGGFSCSACCSWCWDGL